MGDVLYGCSNAGGIHIRDESYPNRSLCWVYLIDGLVDPGDRHVCGTCTRTHAARGRQDAPADPTPVPAVTRDQIFEAVTEALWYAVGNDAAADEVTSAVWMLIPGPAPQPKVLWEGEVRGLIAFLGADPTVTGLPGDLQTVPVTPGARVLVVEAPASKEPA